MNFIFFILSPTDFQVKEDASSDDTDCNVAFINHALKGL